MSKGLTKQQNLRQVQVEIFADDILNVAKMLEFVFDQVENV